VNAALEIRSKQFQRVGPARRNARPRGGSQFRQLTTAEARKAERSLHPDSMDLVFRGRAWFNKGLTPDYLMQAQSYFEQALARDPGNIEAMAGLALVNAAVGAAFITDDWLARLTAAEALSTKVLSIAPNHARSHLCLGIVQMHTKRLPQGIRECERALVLDRNSSNAHALIGYAKFLLGRGAETEGHIVEALRLSPRDALAHLWMVWVGFAKVQLNNDTEAVAWLRTGLEANRNYSFAHFHLAAALGRLGELEQARAAAQAGLALDPSFTVRRYRDLTNAWTDDPTYLAGRNRAILGMQLAGVPEN
jgi:tetratricopeptide (TPR) repeat protein